MPVTLFILVVKHQIPIYIYIHFLSQFEEKSLVPEKLYPHSFSHVTCRSWVGLPGEFISSVTNTTEQCVNSQSAINVCKVRELFNIGKLGTLDILESWLILAKTLSSSWFDRKAFGAKKTQRNDNVKRANANCHILVWQTSKWFGRTLCRSRWREPWGTPSDEHSQMRTGWRLTG